MDCLTIEDTYFFLHESDKRDDRDDSIRIAGKCITPELLAEALHSLAEKKKKVVLLYYFMNMSDREIAKLFGVPRSTVQYRRTSSFKALKKYLEENAYDYENEE